MLYEIIRSLKAFIDDVILHTMMMVQTNTLDDLQECRQEQLQWWAALVQVTGGELNPQKCCRLVYT